MYKGEEKLMFSIEDLMTGNISSYPEDVQEYMKVFTEKLREHIVEELIRDKADKIMKNIDKSKDYLIDVLGNILENGHKGYNNMSTRTLVNIYLETKGQEDFINLLEKVEAELS